MKKTYYVYKLTDKTTNEFYYGSRSCYGNHIDDMYMGSMVTWEPNKENLIKEIIKSDFLNREECNHFERELIKNNINHPLNRNYHIPNENFHKDGSAGMLFKNLKVLKEYAKKYGVEIKSKWGIEEQNLIFMHINNEMLPPHTINVNKLPIKENPPENTSGFKFKIAKCGT